MCEEKLESFCSARHYRRLWLNSEDTLGLVAEELADALAWQPTDDQLMPDALELAQVAASRLHELETRLIAQQPRLKAKQRVYA